jgi:hypothetical protein
LAARKPTRNIADCRLAIADLELGFDAGCQFLNDVSRNTIGNWQSTIGNDDNRQLAIDNRQ